MQRAKTSAVAADLQWCVGSSGRMCGLSWSKGKDWNGTQGVGQQVHRQLRPGRAERA
jgi:mannan endo-1,6-alpha-mannosidase